jgi:Na+/melibiose symporter and related transporters
MKLKYKKTFLLGFGFFAISLTWSLYNSFVPIFLRKFIDSNFWVGFIMTLDNYAGLFLQPIFGTLSDRTRTKFGRRMPYLLFGMPVAAAFICLIPLHWSLASLIVSIVCLNLTMATFRSPTIALMPDLTPAPLRSKANGIINLMGGVGSVVAYLVGSKLYSLNPSYPFFMAAALIIISIIILVNNIKEQRDSINYDDIPDTKENEVNTYQENSRLTPNVLFLLLAIFFWFVSFNAVEAFFTLYGKYYLNINEAVAASKFTFFSLSMVVFAIPAGLIATRIGKKKTITIGLVLMILSFGGLLFASNINAIGYIFIFAGACWALININSYPFVVSMTDNANVGKYTGYYYLFSSLAAITSPPLVGKLIDWWGYGILFKYTVVGFIFALIFILLVKPPVEKDVQDQSPIETLENLDV